MKALITKKDLNGIDQRSLTTKNLAHVILNIMKNHIGYESAISRPELFKKVFKQDEEDNLSDWLRWEFVKKAMNYLRRNTHCFIANEKQGNIYKYFVIQSTEDAKIYIARMERNIQAIRRMEHRAIKAVKERWWSERWEIKQSDNHPLLEE